LTRPRDPLPAHLIRPEDVPAWLGGSVNKLITTHRTDEASARSIREHGIRIERSDPDGGWGQGFYSGTRSDAQYGDVSVRVAVRLLRPFLAHDPIADQERIGALLARAGTDDIREALMAAGHDGVVVHWGPGDMWVVAYTSEQVRVLWRP